MIDPAAPVTLTDAMARAGRDALRRAAGVFEARVPDDPLETQAMAVVVYEAMVRAASEPPKRSPAKRAVPNPRLVDVPYAEETVAEQRARDWYERPAPEPPADDLAALIDRVSSAAWAVLDLLHGGGYMDDHARHLRDAIKALDAARQAAGDDGSTSVD